MQINDIYGIYFRFYVINAILCKSALTHMNRRYLHKWCSIHIKKLFSWNLGCKKKSLESSLKTEMQRFHEKQNVEAITWERLENTTLFTQSQDIRQTWSFFSSCASFFFSASLKQRWKKEKFSMRCARQTWEFSIDSPLLTCFLLSGAQATRWLLPKKLLTRLRHTLDVVLPGFQTEQEE